MKFWRTVGALFIIIPSACAPSVETPYDADYLPSTAFRPEVERAVAAANDLLVAAGHEISLQTDWETEVWGLPPTDDSIITVYLVRSAATPSAVSAATDNAIATINAILETPTAVDPAYEGCRDEDDCVEFLYTQPEGAPVSANELALDVLEQIAANDLGVFRASCRCIVLKDFDLDRFNRVIGYPWDAYLLALRFETEEELLAAADEGRIPDSMLDGEGLTLQAWLPFLLLHEVGHAASMDSLSALQAAGTRLGDSLSSFSEPKRAEAAADAFAASILARGCFDRQLEPDVINACLGPSILSALLYTLGLYGKSKEARCVRYFDATATHPNIYLRLLIATHLQQPENDPGKNLLEDFLQTRDALSVRPWISANEFCHRRHGLTFPDAKSHATE